MAEGDDYRAEEDENRNERLDVDRHQKRGDRCTDFGAEQHAYSLTELHQSGVRETDDHRVGSRGALNDGGDERTYKHRNELVAGNFLQQISQLVTCGKLQTLAHVFHTDQKQTETAERHNDL